MPLTGDPMGTGIAPTHGRKGGTVFDDYLYFHRTRFPLRDSPARGLPLPRLRITPQILGAHHKAAFLGSHQPGHCCLGRFPPPGETGRAGPWLVLSPTSPAPLGPRPREVAGGRLLAPWPPRGDTSCPPLPSTCGWLGWGDHCVPWRGDPRGGVEAPSAPSSPPGCGPSGLQCRLASLSRSSKLYKSLLDQGCEGLMAVCC